MDFLLDYYFYYRFLFTTENLEQRKEMIRCCTKCFIISSSFTWLYFWSKVIQLRPSTIMKKSLLYGGIISTFQASYFGTPKLDRFLCKQI